MVRFVLACSALMLLGACGAMSDSGPEGPGGETHFLLKCTEDAECGEGLACVCGTCTLACTMNEECAGEFGGTESVCVTEGSAAFDNTCPVNPWRTRGMCLPTCSVDADCELYNSNQELTCLEGVCAGVPRNDPVELPAGDWSQTTGPAGTGSAPIFVSNGGALFLGADSHLLRSTDGGKSWVPSHEARVTSLIDAGEVILAQSEASGLVRSVDGGASFAPATAGGLPGGLVALFGGDDAVYGIAENRDAGGLRVAVRSVDAGNEWSGCGALPGDEPVGTVFPAADVVLATTLSTGKLYRSEDGCASWSLVADGTGPGWAAVFASHGGGIFALEPGQRLVFRSVDSGKTWSQTVLGQFARVTGVPFLASSGDGLFATFGAGSVFRWDGEAWSEAARNLRGNALTSLDGSAEGAWLTAGQQLYRWDRDAGSWAKVDAGPVESRVVALVGNEGFLAASTGGDAVHVSLDGGATWEPRGAGLPVGSQVTSLGTFSLELWASTVDGRVFVSPDAGQSWSAAGSGLDLTPVEAGRPMLVSAWCVTDSMALAGTADGTLSWDGSVGAAGRGIFRTTDHGASWEPASEGLPRLGDGAYAPIVGIWNEGKSLVASVAGAGLFRSTDDGASWTAIEGLAGETVTAYVHAGDEMVAAVLRDGVTAIRHTRSPPAGWNGEAVFEGVVVDLEERDRALLVSVDFASDDAKDGVWGSTDRGTKWARIGAASVSAGPMAQLAEGIFLGTSDAGVWRLDAR